MITRDIAVGKHYGLVGLALFQIEHYICGNNYATFLVHESHWYKDPEANPVSAMAVSG